MSTKLTKTSVREGSASAAGTVFAPRATFYPEITPDELAVLAVSLHGGSAQLNLDADQAIKLGRAMVEWGESQKAGA